jgi:hypothetical protein
VLTKGRTKLRRRSLRLKSEKGIGKYRFEGIENDEGKSGTICSANNGNDSANSGIGS